MFERFRATVPGEESVRILHVASRLILVNAKKNNWVERAVQDKAGAPLKVLTPYQVASIAFGTRGFESMLVDLHGCDVILDEIHTYTDVSRAIVLRIIEVVKAGVIVDHLAGAKVDHLQHLNQLHLRRIPAHLPE